MHTLNWSNRAQTAGSFVETTDNRHNPTMLTFVDEMAGCHRLGHRSSTSAFHVVVVHIPEAKHDIAQRARRDAPVGLGTHGRERMMREALYDIAASFGPADYRKVGAAGEPATELSDALGQRGFLGVHLPEEYGGGGLGLQELTAIFEETDQAIQTHGGNGMALETDLSSYWFLLRLQLIAPVSREIGAQPCGRTLVGPP